MSASCRPACNEESICQGSSLKRYLHDGVIFTQLSQVFRRLSGIFTLVLIPLFLTKEQQGCPFAAGMRFFQKTSQTCFLKLRIRKELMHFVTPVVTLGCHPSLSPLVVTLTDESR